MASQFRVNAFQVNAPYGHNDELNPDGPRRVNLLERFAKDAEADIGFMEEFHRIQAMQWKTNRIKGLSLYQAEYNSGGNNGNAEFVNSNTCRMLDFQSVPIFEQNAGVGLVQHVGSGSVFGAVVHHIPALTKGATSAERAKIDKELKAICDAFVDELGIPVVTGQDRNRKAAWNGYDARRADVQWIMVRKGSIVYGKAITAAHGIITDHTAALKVRVSMPTNSRKIGSLDRIL